MVTKAAALLGWYDRDRRDLPWRAPPGTRGDPYAVWLSEIMLQQTTVATVGRYFRLFRERWPDVQSLAAAPIEEVLSAWSGLGYYARARNLHACAQAVVRDHGGRFPADEAALARLPGIGTYTAAAIAAIAFDLPAAPVDGNIERVVARLFAVHDPLPGSKPRLRALTRSIAATDRPGDFAQGMMDLGAMVCTPRRPACALCPFAEDCAARRDGIAETLPAKTPKAERPIRRGVAYVAIRNDGAVLLRRRPARGLLGGMMEAPSTAWGPAAPDDPLAEAPLPAEWRRAPGGVTHVFTHFRLDLEVLVARLDDPAPTLPDGLAEARWVAPRALSAEALPTLTVKVLTLAGIRAPRP